MSHNPKRPRRIIDPTNPAAMKQIAEQAQLQRAAQPTREQMQHMVTDQFAGLLHYFIEQKRLPKSITHKLTVINETLTDMLTHLAPSGEAPADETPSGEAPDPDDPSGDEPEKGDQNGQDDATNGEAGTGDPQGGPQGGPAGDAPVDRPEDGEGE